MSRSSFWVLGLLCSAVWACSSTKDAVRSRFAKDFGCSSDAVTVSEAGANIYVASGCSERAEYVCKTFSGTDRDLCTQRGVHRKDEGIPQAPYRQDQVPPK